MRILVCGDREWTDREAIARQLRLVRTIVTLEGKFWDHEEPEAIQCVLIHGAARGADRIAGEEGAKLGFEVKPYPVPREDWAYIGRGAGHVRNQLMLDEGRPDLVLAFHPNLVESRGTADMVRRARSAGIPTEVFAS